MTGLRKWNLLSLKKNVFEKDCLSIRKALNMHFSMFLLGLMFLLSGIPY